MTIQSKNTSIENNKKMNDMYIYARSSTNYKNNKNIVSIERQIDTCKEYLNKNGYNLVNTYIDLGVSSKVLYKDRIGFMTMLKEFENDQRSQHNIIIEDLSILLRSHELLNEFLKIRAKYNIVLYSIYNKDINEKLDNPIKLEGLIDYLDAERNILLKRVEYSRSVNKKNESETNPVNMKISDPYYPELKIDPVIISIIKNNPKLTLVELRDLMNQTGILNLNGKPFSLKNISIYKKLILSNLNPLSNLSSNRSSMISYNDSDNKSNSSF